MKYDEFSEKLELIKKEYEDLNKKKLVTIKELEDFMFHKKTRFKNRRALTSLKGMNF
jgi:hypothetical protein